MSDRLNETRYWDEDDGPTGAAMWELQEIYAWEDGEGGWTRKYSSVLKRFRSESINLKGLFLRVLADVRGRPLPRGGACSGSTTATGTSSRYGEDETDVRYGR